LPVPVPDLKDGDPVKSRAYDAIKDSLADPWHLPSFKPSTTPTAESLAFDKELANKVPNHLADRNKRPKLWVPNHVRSCVRCSGCNKYRCVYAWPLLHEDFGEQLHQLKNVIKQPLYEYICGNQILGMAKNKIPHHPIINKCFQVKTALVCGMPMEAHYYSSSKKFEPVCYCCGSPDNLVDTETLQ
jgi:hypothetical protein